MWDCSRLKLLIGNQPNTYFHKEKKTPKNVILGDIQSSSKVRTAFRKKTAFAKTVSDRLFFFTPNNSETYVLLMT